MKSYPWATVLDFAQWASVPALGVDTILFGAGVSKAAPTGAPLGWELCRDALLALLDSVAGPGSALGTDVIARLATSQLRLESVMQTWFDVSHHPALFAAYNSLASLEPNENHHLLAQLRDVDLLTLNMDTCVEDAANCASNARREVLHLHGTWHDPESIKTTIQSYEDGLEPPLLEALSRAYGGKNVLVAGYSGQDSDVLPRFLDTPPRTIQWIHHDPRFDLTPEAENVLRQAAQKGSAVRVLTGDATDYLRMLSGTTSCARRCVPTRDTPVPSLSDALLGQPDTIRVLALATILSSLGMWDESVELLGRIPDTDALHPRALKLQGRFLRLAGRPEEASALLGWPPNNRPRLRRFSYSINEALAAGLEAHSPAALAVHAVLASLPSALLPGGPRVDLLASTARSRFAQYLNMRAGWRAAGRYASVPRGAISTENFGNRASQAAYRADILKTTGRFRDALNLLREFDDWVSFLSVHSQTDFRWRRGELLALTGDADAALEDLSWVRAATTISPAKEQRLWHLSTCLAVMADDLDLVGEVYDAINDRQHLSPAVRCFGLFSLAERHFHIGDVDVGNEALTRAESTLETTDWLWRLPSYELVADYLRVRSDLARGHTPSLERLSDIERRFERIGMPSMAARCHALAWRTFGTGAPPAALVRTCEDNLWNAEARMLTETTWPPLQLVV